MPLVVLLRGVNIGGHRTFRPKVLAEDMREFGVENIGAAGTFVVRGAVTRSRLREELARRLPFDTEIMICEGREIARVASADHFAGHRERPDVRRFLSVLARSPRSAPAVPLALPERGGWLLRVLARDGRYLVGMYRRQMKAISQLGTLDRLFGQPATTRNWNTVGRIVRALER